jgi:hypothetical protein
LQPGYQRIIWFIWLLLTDASPWPNKAVSTTKLVELCAEIISSPMHNNLHKYHQIGHAVMGIDEKHHFRL